MQRVLCCSSNFIGGRYVCDAFAASARGKGKGSEGKGRSDEGGGEASSVKPEDKGQGEGEDADKYSVSEGSHGTSPLNFVPSTPPSPFTPPEKCDAPAAKAQRRSRSRSPVRSQATQPQTQEEWKDDPGRGHKRYEGVSLRRRGLHLSSSESD